MYGDDTFYRQDYGLHYNGWAARDDRGLCPSGFAIPVNANFENLLASATENQLVSAAGWDNESWNGNNESGFSLIPAGYISSSGSSGGSQSYLWSQSVRDIYYPANWNFLRSGDNEPYLQSDLTMGKGLSVRCVSVVSGCMDADACNYDENANADSGACDYSCQEFVDPSGEGPCQGQTSVIYQGHTYPVVEVENQCWFAENLQSTAYANGDAIVAPADADDWSDYAQSSTGTVTTGYSYDSDFWLATYGRLYSGHAVLDARNLCPSGWAVPTSQDFTNLINTGLNGELRSTTGMDNESYNGTNATGFNLRPSGYDQNGDNVGTRSYLFSSSVNGENLYVSRFTSKCASMSVQAISNGLAVRCLKVNAGCTDASSCNYDAIATEDDGSCDYSCTGWVASDGTGPCAGAETLTYQGDVYTLVEIGDQCWFRENLRAEDFANDEAIPTGDGNAFYAAGNAGTAVCCRTHHGICCCRWVALQLLRCGRCAKHLPNRMARPIG